MSDSRTAITVMAGHDDGVPPSVSLSAGWYTHSHQESGVDSGKCLHRLKKFRAAAGILLSTGILTVDVSSPHPCHPIVSVSEVGEVIGITYPAANTLVDRLAKVGILTEVTGHTRNRRFRYDPYIRMFTDDTGEDAIP